MSRLRKVGAFLGLVPDEQDQAALHRSRHDDFDADYHGEYDDRSDGEYNARGADYHAYYEQDEYTVTEVGESEYAPTGYQEYGDSRDFDADPTEQIPAYSGASATRTPLVTAGGGRRDRHEERDYPVQGSLAMQPEVRVDATPDPIATVKPATITLTGFADAREVGETYRAGQAVILDMTDLTDAEARRMVDFAAGLAFAVRGSIDKVTQKVFMLHPPTADAINGG